MAPNTLRKPRPGFSLFRFRHSPAKLKWTADLERTAAIVAFTRPSKQRAATKSAGVIRRRLRLRRPGAPATQGRQISKCYRRLIGAGGGAGFAYLIRVGAMAAATDAIGIETVVWDGGDQHAVAVNVDIARSRPAP